MLLYNELKPHLVQINILCGDIEEEVKSKEIGAYKYTLVFIHFERAKSSNCEKSITSFLHYFHTLPFEDSFTYVPEIELSLRVFFAK